MQISGYAFMAELFGLKYKGSILCHIRPDNTGVFSKINNNEKEIVEFISILDLRNEFKRISEHHFNSTNYKREQILF